MSEVSPTSPCDFFISRTGVDAEWAQWIAWTLEDADYHVYLQDWDFHPGRSFIHDMQEGATNCSRTIAVLSPDYFDSAFSNAEWEAALTKDPTGADRALTTVRVAQCDPPGLLARYPYIDLVGRDEATARDLLLVGVADGRRKPAVAPRFPAHNGAPTFPGRSAEALDSEDITDGSRRAQSLLPTRGGNASGGLYVGVAGIPRTPLVRPSALSDDSLMQSMRRRAMDMDPPLLEVQDTTHQVANGRLVIQQRDRAVTLDSPASGVLVMLPTFDRDGGTALLSSIIEEDIRERIAHVLSFLAATLDALDTANRMTYVVPIAALVGVDYVGWRTRAERDANPNMMTMNMQGSGTPFVLLDPPAIARHALRAERHEVAADFTALLRDRSRQYH
jgi:TIR domain